MISAGSKGVPESVMRLVRVQLEGGHGLQAVHRLCSRVFVRTTLATAGLKCRVRGPPAASSDAKVAEALADWESDLQEAEQRGFDVDNDDKEVALYGIVAGLRSFEPTVVALQTMDPPADWKRVLEKLRDRADDLASMKPQPASLLPSSVHTL